MEVHTRRGPRLQNLLEHETGHERCECVMLRTNRQAKFERFFQLRVCLITEVLRCVASGPDRLISSDMQPVIKLMTIPRHMFLLSRYDIWFASFGHQSFQWMSGFWIRFISEAFHWLEANKIQERRQRAMHY